MLHPTGLAKFAQVYPDRVFDVGIAEQHAVTSAAGLAMGGMHPVVAIYATFLNRAFDQVLMDVAMHKLPVTFVLDRAGVTGPDGASHHGMWDGSLLQIVPGIKVAVPRDGTRLTELLREAVAISDGPTAIRFPRGSAPDDLPAIGKLGDMDLLAVPAEGTGQDVLLVGVGPMAEIAVDVAERLTGQGIGVTVVDPRWVKPVDEAIAQAAARHKLVVTVEDNGTVGGFGDAVARTLRDAEVSDAAAHLRPAAAFPRARRARRGARACRADLSAARPRHHRSGRQTHGRPGHRSPGLACADCAATLASRSAVAATKSISSWGSRTVKSTPSAARWKVSAPRESEPVVSRQPSSPASVMTPEVRENSSATTAAGACTSIRAW